MNKNTSFDAVIAQKGRKAADFIYECHAFADSIQDWVRQYPRLLWSFKEVLNLVINELGHIQGIRIQHGENNFKMTFNQKEFIYHFQQNLPYEVGSLVVSEQDKMHLAQEENKIVQEIAEIISLDLHIGSFMKYIAGLNRSYNILVVADTVKATTDINAPGLIRHMHLLSRWWFQIDDVMKKLKQVTYTAVELDKRVAKQLLNLFSEERKKKINDLHMKTLKSALLILVRIPLEFIPFGSTVIETTRTVVKYKQELAGL